MGLGDFFRRRAERESAIPPASEQPTLGSFATSEGQPVVGRPLDGGAGTNPAEIPGMLEGLQALSQLGPMIQQAMQSGNVQVQPDGSYKIESAGIEIEQGAAQTIDMRGSGLSEEIVEIMKAHGIDPDGAGSGPIDASALPDMQLQILQALAKHGIDPGSAGSIDFGGESGEVR